MTTYLDVPVDLLIPALGAKLVDEGAVSAPEWAEFVKTGVTRERPPTQTDWWQVRAAAILRKIARLGPVGVTALSQSFGGYKDNGSMPNTPAAGSRHVIRTAIQQLEAAGLVELVDLKPIENVDGETQMLHRGRVVTAAGQRMLDAVAHDVRPTAEASYPGLDKY